MAERRLVGEVHEFNTGRRYQVDGQRIRWAVTETEAGDREVIFEDVSRMITGAIPLFFGNMDLVTNDWVLKAYDLHLFKNTFVGIQELLK